jgi:hypothetical protein
MWTYVGKIFHLIPSTMFAGNNMVNMEREKRIGFFHQTIFTPMSGTSSYLRPEGYGAAAVHYPAKMLFALALARLMSKSRDR